MLPTDILDKYDTPFYYYDLGVLRCTLELVKSASDYPGFHVHYALKANVNPAILNVVAGYGFGADTVSGGEIVRALEAGFNPESIVFAGVGKSDREIALALRSGIGCFNVESSEELARIEELAREAGMTANVALRVNPDVDAHTHHYITTGLAENKFGIDMDMLEPIIEHCISSDSINFRGLHFHIGSQITTLEPFRILCDRINGLQDYYESRGISFASINVGGGLGINYDNPDADPVPDFKSYFDVFHKYLKLRPGQELHFELGRSIVGQCGSLISRVLYVKSGRTKKFVILDAGFTELIRPALYGAHHQIQNLTSHSVQTEKYDVVGPICESSDTFGTDVLLPETNRGDMIALRSAGAYGEVMASQYNCRPLPKSVFSE